MIKAIPLKHTEGDTGHYSFHLSSIIYNIMHLLFSKILKWTFLCNVRWPRSSPECCIIVCCCTSFMCSPRESHGTVLCYCVIHHTAAMTRCHFYYWYNESRC